MEGGGCINYSHYRSGNVCLAEGCMMLKLCFIVLARKTIERNQQPKANQAIMMGPVLALNEHVNARHSWENQNGYLFLCSTINYYLSWLSSKSSLQEAFVKNDVFKPWPEYCAWIAEGKIELRAFSLYKITHKQQFCDCTNNIYVISTETHTVRKLSKTVSTTQSYANTLACALLL